MTSMSAVEKHLPASDDDLAHGQAARREGLASATMEGGEVGADAKAIIGDWARGLITEDQAIALIKALHVQQSTGETSAA